MASQKYFMQKLITAFLVFFISLHAIGQTPRKMAIYLLAQYNKTIYDKTKGNNPWGIGLGGQVFFNNKSKFKPTIEFTSDEYLMSDKVYRIYSDGTPIQTVNTMTNIFFGASYNPSHIIFISFTAGPSCINSQTLIGIKPTFGFYFSASQKWMGKIAYINIFKREIRAREDFSSFSLSIGRKLF
jgi:hypothetical protein